MNLFVSFFGIPFFRTPVFMDDGLPTAELLSLIGFVIVVMLIMSLIGGYDRQNWSDWLPVALIIGCVAILFGLTALLAPGFMLLVYLTIGLSWIAHKIGVALRDRGG